LNSGSLLLNGRYSSEPDVGRVGPSFSGSIMGLRKPMKLLSR